MRRRIAGTNCLKILVLEFRLELLTSALSKICVLSQIEKDPSVK